MRRMAFIFFLVLAGCSATQSRHVVDSAKLESPASAPVAGRVIDSFDTADD